MRQSRRCHRRLARHVSGAVALTVGALAGMLVAPLAAQADVAVVGSTSDRSALSRSSITLERPPGSRSGHLLLATVAVTGDMEFIAPPGWTLVRQDRVDVELRQAIYVKVGGGSEPDTYAWKLATGSLRRLAGGMTAYSGVDPSRPVDVHGAATGDSAAVTSPSVTPTVDGTLLVHLAAVGGQGTITPPPAMTERFEAASPSLTSPRGVVVASADAPAGPAGPTGTRTATTSVANLNVGAILALRPLASPDPDPEPDPDPDPDPTPGQGQMMLGWHQDGDVPGELAEIETTFEKRFGMVRSYSSTWSRPSRKLAPWANQGKFILWSVKPVDDPDYGTAADPGGKIRSWAASAEDVAGIDAQITDLQAIAVNAGLPHIAYILNHEPHDESSDWDSRLDKPGIQAKCTVGKPSDPCFGTNRDFRNLYAAARRRIDALGADRVLLTYVGVGDNMAADRGTGVGSGDPMYPGDDVVDLLGTDPYNWGCFRNCEWESFEEISASSIALARARDKRLVIAEVASHMGCALLERANGCSGLSVFHRDEWLRQMATFLTTDADARRYVIGFSYFHTVGNNDWRFVDYHVGGDLDGKLLNVDNRGLEGFLAAFVRDSKANGENADFFSSTMFRFGLDPTP